KGDENKVVIQSHFGVMCCRAGYTPEGRGFMKPYPTDIKFLRQAKYLNEAGYTVLMFDFRNHGESGLGTVPWVTWGKDEAKDMVAAVDFITTHPDYKEASVGLLSICMGQGATTQAFGLEDGLRKYVNLKCMISVQPMDYPTFVDALGLPGFVARSTNKVIRKRTGIDFEQSSWVPSVKDINVPTLVIQNENDAYLNRGFIDAYYENLTVEKEMLWIELPKAKTAFENRAAAYAWLGENPDPVLRWFNKHI
ncbi:MAG: alpha/beta hydrolase, partial [Myxococcota bacterium]